MSSGFYEESDINCMLSEDCDTDYKDYNDDDDEKENSDECGCFGSCMDCLSLTW